MLHLIGRVTKLVQATIENRYEYHPISDQSGSGSKVQLISSERGPILRVEKGKPGVVLKFNRSKKEGSELTGTGVHPIQAWKDIIGVHDFLATLQKEGFASLVKETNKKKNNILSKPLSIPPTNIRAIPILGNPQTQGSEDVLYFVISAICVSFAIKYHLSLDCLSVSQIFGEVVDSFSRDCLSVLGVDRFYDCSCSCDVEASTSSAGAVVEADNRLGKVLLVGTLLLTAFLFAEAKGLNSKFV